MCEKLGEPFAREVFDANGNLFHHLSIFVNDRGLDGDRRLEATLYGGEVDLLILPVFEGG
ncbi:MAG: hypothetical protein HY675_00165 [Chloroflexi bacterium]|nr:hypothetical protein [Chloroflexota bacterium]